MRFKVSDEVPYSPVLALPCDRTHVKKLMNVASVRWWITAVPVCHADRPGDWQRWWLDKVNTLHATTTVLLKWREQSVLLRICPTMEFQPYLLNVYFLSNTWLSWSITTHSYKCKCSFLKCIGKASTDQLASNCKWIATKKDGDFSRKTLEPAHQCCSCYCASSGTGRGRSGKEIAQAFCQALSFPLSFPLSLSLSFLFFLSIYLFHFLLKCFILYIWIIFPQLLLAPPHLPTNQLHILSLKTPRKKITTKWKSKQANSK